MPFGRWRGVPLTDIDGQYLDWLTTIELRPWLRDAVEAELQRRKDERECERRWRNWQEQRTWEQQRARAEPPKAPRNVDGVVALEIIKRGYRLLSLEAHPDRGGSTARMQAINSAASWLREVCGRALPAGR